MAEIKQVRKLKLDGFLTQVSQAGAFKDALLATDKVMFSNLGTSRRLHLRIESEHGDVFGLTLAETLSDKVKEMLSGGTSDTLIISNLIKHGQVIENVDGVKFLVASQMGKSVEVQSASADFEELIF